LLLRNTFLNSKVTALAEIFYNKNLIEAPSNIGAKIKWAEE